MIERDDPFKRYCGGCMREYKAQHPNARFARLLVDRGPAERCMVCKRVEARRFYLLQHENLPGYICDFCNGKPVVAIWRARPFEMYEGREPNTKAALTYVDDGEWGVCAACDRDVADDQPGSVLARSVRAFKVDDPLRVIRLAELQSRFWHGKTGERLAIASRSHAN